MKIVVIGGGSVGLLMASRLGMVSSGIHLITRREEQAAQIRSNGIMLHSLTKESCQIKVDASPISEGLPEAEVYLITVKQPDLHALLPVLQQTRPASRVISFQNGMGHHELFMKFLPDHLIYYGINSEGAKRISPVEVIHTGTGHLRIGPWLGSLRSGKDMVLEKILAILVKSGLRVDLVEDAKYFMWKKLIVNSVINPLTALYEIPNGGLLETSMMRNLMREVFLEAQQTASYSGQTIDESDWQEILTVCQRTAANYSSMLQDILAGKRTEIDSITGYLLKVSQDNQLVLPLNEVFYQLIKTKESIGKAREE